MPFDPNTRQYIPPEVSGYFAPDLYNFTSPVVYEGKARSTPNFTARIVDRSRDYEIVQWRLVIEDLRGGIGAEQAMFADTFDRTSFKQTTADTRFYRQAILGPRPVNVTLPITIGTGMGIHHAHVFDVLWMGRGSTSQCLIRETSSSNPALTTVSYSPGSSIISMAPIVIGGTTSARRLAIGRQSGPVQVIGSLSGTVDLTLHTNTTACYGIIQVPTLSDSEPDPILLYAGNAIRRLLKTQSTDAPTTLLNNVPNGGMALGLVRLGGAPLMAAWLWPRRHLTGHMYQIPIEPGRVVLTDLRAVSYFELDMGLPYVTHAVIYNGTAIFASDGSRITVNDGRAKARDLGWPASVDGLANNVTSLRPQVLGMCVNGAELWVMVNYLKTDSTNEIALFIYDIPTNAWHRLVKIQSDTSPPGGDDTPVPSYPLSPTTRRLYASLQSAGLQSMHRFYVPHYGENPFETQRLVWPYDPPGDGFDGSVAKIMTPAWELPGLEGWPKTVSRIVFMGDVDAGNTDFGSGAYVEVGVVPDNVTGNIPTVRFSSRMADRPQIAEWPDKSLFYRLQLLISMQRGSDPKATPNALPIAVEGYAYIKLPPRPSFIDDVR